MTTKQKGKSVEPVLELKDHKIPADQANRITKFVEAVSQEMGRRRSARMAGRNYAEAELTKVLKTIRTSQESLLKEVIKARKLLDATKEEQQVEENDKTGEELISSLLNHAQIQDVVFADKNPIIITDRMWCVDTRTKRTHYIGRFAIIFRGQDLTRVRIFNLDFQVDAFNGWNHAPHSLYDAIPCLGQLGNLLVQLGRQGDFYGAVSACLVFLESVNMADPAGKNIKFWPYIKKSDKEDKYYIVNKSRIRKSQGFGGITNTERQAIKKYWIKDDEYLKFVDSMEETRNQNVPANARL